MTEEEKKTIEQMFEAMGNSGGRFVIGQVVGSQTINFNGKTPTVEINDETDPDLSKDKHKGGRPKRAGRTINKAFKYNVGDETNVRLQFLYNGLKALQWIKADTQLKSFLSLFSGNETTCRVVWKGEINTLSELFRELVMRKRIVQLPQGESLWIMVNARFWDKEGNHEFGNKRLGSARASLENKDSIRLLVSAMNPQVPIEKMKKAFQSRK